MHTTRLKQRLLEHFPDMRAQTKGRGIMLVLDENIGVALSKACEQERDCDSVILLVLHKLSAEISFLPNPSLGHFC